MPLLINSTHPGLRIYNPDNGEYAQFTYGRLEIGPDDPNYGTVMAEASRNPFITIVTTATFCPRCGVPFEGSTAKDDLAAHVKSDHFDTYLADLEAAQGSERIQLIKANAGIACDICQPVQVFADADALALHAKVVHASGEEEAPAPETPSRSRRRPGEVG